MKSLSLSQPHALIMVGIPGSGKTFFAEKFSSMFSAPLIDLEQIAPYARDEAAADQLLMLQLQETVKTKASIVIEADASSRTRRTELSKFVRDHGYVPLFVWVQTDKDTAKQRCAKRKKLSSVEFGDSMKRFSPPHESEKALVISGKHTYASQAKIVLKKLSAPRIAQPEARHASSQPGRITIQ